MNDELRYKRCSKCGKDKPLTAFYTMFKGPEGRRPECKVCTRPGTGNPQRRKAYGRAMAEIRERHLKEFEKIYNKELTKMGLKVYEHSTDYRSRRGL